VTDGETNATLRKDDDPEQISSERGYELLADKRARGPVKKTARKAAKKTTTRTSTTRTSAAAKKSGAKTAAAKASAAKTSAASPSAARATKQARG
jgi:DNA topoisomerase-1